MRFINKMGLILLIMAASVGPAGSAESGIGAMILFFLGAVLFLLPDGLK